jgi:malate dehydrogenase
MSLTSLVAMITIIGTGEVDSTAAFDIFKDHINDVVLIDLNAELARDKALDMMQAAPVIEFDGKIRGTDDFKEMKGPELVIDIAGQGRKPSMSRLDLMNINAKIKKAIASLTF